MGRPTKYDPGYCDELVAFMAQGYSMTAFAAQIGVDRDTITEWGNVHDEFSLAIKKGKAACASWWESVNRNNAMTGDGNATSCIFGLKNMAADDWSDRKSIDHTSSDDSLSSNVTVYMPDNGRNDASE